MATVNDVISKLEYSTISLDRIISIKKYIKIDKKIEFVEELHEKFNKNKAYFQGYDQFCLIVVMNLLAVKYYTNIEIECTIDEYDRLKEYGILDYILEYIKVDYLFLVELIK